MKLISLNIWGGHEFSPLISFLTHHRNTTDIFCLQEVYSSLNPTISRGIRTSILEEIVKILPEHQFFFSSIQDNIDDEGMVNMSTVCLCPLK